MAGIDHAQPMSLDVEHHQEEGDVQVQHAAVVELMVELPDDPGRVGIALEEQPDLGRELGGQQARPASPCPRRPPRRRPIASRCAPVRFAAERRGKKP